jgi:hypothetical protein
MCRGRNLIPCLSMLPAIAGIVLGTLSCIIIGALIYCARYV